MAWVQRDLEVMTVMRVMIPIYEEVSINCYCLWIFKAIYSHLLISIASIVLLL